jgi:hypothetical protein
MGRAHCTPGRMSHRATRRRQGPTRLHTDGANIARRAATLSGAIPATRLAPAQRPRRCTSPQLPLQVPTRTGATPAMAETGQILDARQLDGSAAATGSVPNTCPSRTDLDHRRVEHAGQAHGPSSGLVHSKSVQCAFESHRGHPASQAKSPFTCGNRLTFARHRVR